MHGLAGYLLQSSLLIIIAFAARALFCRRITHGVFRLVWLAVAARMLVPVPLSTPSGLPSFASWLASSGFASFALAGGGSDSVVPTSQGAAASVGDGDAAGILFAVWLSGAAVCAAFFTVRYLCALGRTVPLGEADDRAVLRWLGEVRLRRRVRAAWSDVGTPAVRGVFRPVVLLPMWFPLLDEGSKLTALEHELVHIRRFDTAAKALLLCAACVQWFNPLAWAVVSIGFCDIELACDEAVLRGAPPKGRSAYARLLVDVADLRQGSLTSLSGGGYASLRKRIFAAMRPVDFRLSAVCAAFAMLFAATALSALPPRQWIVGTDDYRLVIPECWSGRVSVSCDGSETLVFPNGNPDCPLVIARVVGDGESRGHTSPGLVLLDSEATLSGGRVELWGVDYLSMVAGDVWRTSSFANPDYPGEPVERELINLVTGGACDVDALKGMDGSAGVPQEYYDFLLVPEFEKRNSP